MLGTGLQDRVKGIYAEVIRQINGLDKKIVSVDVPSGLDATTGGELGVAVHADVTATMALPKTGFFVPPGRTLAGRVEVVDIGVPSKLLTDEAIPWNVTEEADLRRILRPREEDSHKGTHGHVLVLAGSPGKSGAAFMASMGAMRAGAGLTTLGIPESISAAMEAKTTEVMTSGLPETADKTLGVASLDRIGLLLEGKSAVVAGPGLGATTDVSRFMEKLLRMVKVPAVIDADGLNSISDGFLRDINTPLVLTPHPGEAARLLKTTPAKVQADRIGCAQRLSKRCGSIVVLKGACTIIAVPSGRVFFNTTGNAGLASAGTGDVLSGMIGGLLAQGYGTTEAAIAAVYIHGLAADGIKMEYGEAGMMATDLLARIPGILNSFTA
jgi:NAD(P)H-hydrate epimerase